MALVLTQALAGAGAVDLSRSMGYTHRQELTKFDYAICLAAALGAALDACGFGDEPMSALARMAEGLGA